MSDLYSYRNWYKAKTKDLPNTPFSRLLFLKNIHNDPGVFNLFMTEVFFALDVQDTAYECHKHTTLH